MKLEADFGVNNYDPLPVVLSSGKGVHVTDVEGKTYYDFLSAYSAVNQGHCHPRLVEAVKKQSETLTLTSRAFFNDKLGPYAKFMCETFGFDRMLPMNTGVEGGESAVKLARRWAYDVKGVPADQAVTVFAHGNFWGRTLGAISSSDDPAARGGFGPFLPGYASVPFNDLPALEEMFKSNPNIAAFMVEPIQGEAGVVVPSEGYLAGVRALCDKYNVLWIADEVQSGLGRSGRLLAVDWEGVRPDLVILGKALSGGMMPVSAVLGKAEVMETLQPGQHGSTYGGNPLACVVATEAVKVLMEEGLVQRSDELGQTLRKTLAGLVSGDSVTETHVAAGEGRDPVLSHVSGGTGLVQEVRGLGLFNALVVRPDAPDGQDAAALCAEFMRRGLLAKPTQKHVIRFAPPLTLSSEQLEEAADIIVQSVRALE
ncbi:Oat [Symbiodinium sp. KB8]|nr:Oat [Symbiodinium sp. KB8]